MMRLQRTSLILGTGLIFLTACGGGGSTTPQTIVDPQPDPKPLPDPPVKPKSNYSLFLQQGIVSIKNSPDTNFGAKDLSVWGFSSVESNPPGNVIVPGTTIDAEINKTVTVNVKNNLATAHDFSFVNSQVTITPSKTPIAVGATTTYTITPKTEGIFIYSDALVNGVNQSLGLYGVMIVRPAVSQGNVVWMGGPSFTKEVTWVIADLDYKNYNTVAINNGANDGEANVKTANYKANYFLMNGMNGFQAMEDPKTTIQGTIDEIVLVRIANTGQYSQSLHFHGNHFQVISRNGVRLKEFESQDTINVKPSQTAMVLYTIDQIGHYPMHVHTAQMETGGGVYLNGTAAMIVGK
ncbi:MAG: multicopper oxidase domain-containing protein [Thiohalomonadales bacterium]